jgi:hypothetical protein
MMTYRSCQDKEGKIMFGIIELMSERINENHREYVRLLNEIRDLVSLGVVLEQDNELLRAITDTLKSSLIRKTKADSKYLNDLTEVGRIEKTYVDYDTSKN